MRPKLFFQICILVLSILFSSCKQQLFLKRKYTDGFFTGGISKKDKPLQSIRDEHTLAKTILKKPFNTVVPKTDSNNLAVAITNHSQIVDIAPRCSVEIIKDRHGLKPVLGSQKSSRSSKVEKQKLTGLDFKSIGLISLISASLISFGFFGSKNNMKLISKWAYRNKWKSRVLIGGVSIANIYASMLIGDLLRQNDVPLPNHLMEFAAAAFGISLVMYPKNKNILFDKNTYIKRKLIHFSLASLSCIMAITSSYHQESYTKFVKFAIPEVMPIKSTLTASKDNNIIKTKSQSVELNITKAVEEYKIKWWQALIIFFIVLTALASTLAIMALSCYIACSGQGGVATLVGVGGTALLIALSVYSIVKIRQIKIDPKKPKTNKA